MAEFGWSVAAEFSWPGGIDNRAPWEASARRGSGSRSAGSMALVRLSRAQTRRLVGPTATLTATRQSRVGADGRLGGVDLLQRASCWASRRTFNPRVEGSIPSGPTAGQSRDRGSDLCPKVGDDSNATVRTVLHGRDSNRTATDRFWLRNSVVGEWVLPLASPYDCRCPCRRQRPLPFPLG